MTPAQDARPGRSGDPGSERTAAEAARRIFIVVGPSGAGKDTLIRGAIARCPGAHWVRRVITRPADPKSEPHEPCTPDAFETRRAGGEFAVSWRAHGLSYGIPRSEVDRPGTLIVNGSRAALPEMLAALPGAEVILVTAPETVLHARLAGRNRETAADIAARRARAGFEVPAGVRVRRVENDGSPATGIARFLDALQPVSG